MYTLMFFSCFDFKDYRFKTTMSASSHCLFVNNLGGCISVHLRLVTMIGGAADEVALHPKSAVADTKLMTTPHKICILFD